jgi:hypothetical protein
MSDNQESSSAPERRSEMLWQFKHPRSGFRFSAFLSPSGDRWQLRVMQDDRMVDVKMFPSRESALTIAEGLRGRIMRDGVLS